MNVQGEKLSADTSVISWYVKSLKGKIEERQLCPEQIFNAGETRTGVYWKAMPSSKLLKVQPLAKRQSDSSCAQQCNRNSQTQAIVDREIWKS